MTGRIVLARIAHLRGSLIVDLPSQALVIDQVILIFFLHNEKTVLQPFSVFLKMQLSGVSIQQESALWARLQVHTLQH
jgi:hypothetical protein